MKGRWLDGALAMAALSAAVGLVRSVLVLHPPAAADLPEPLRHPGPQLAGQRSLVEPPSPARRERDVAWGPAYRFRLRDEGLGLDLVARRSRSFTVMGNVELKEQRLLRLGLRQQVVLGRLDGKAALRTCLVGRGRDEPGPIAAVLEEELWRAAARWRERLDQPRGLGERLVRISAIQAGLRVGERWECLQVSLVLEEAHHQNQADQRLLAAWKELYPQLALWGEQWEGVKF